MSKICNKCQLLKEDLEFRLRYDKRRDSSYLVSICKECENSISKQRYNSDPKYKELVNLKSKKFRESNPEYFKKYKNNYILTQEQKDRYSQKAKDNYIQNKEQLIQKSREWRRMNPNHNRKRRLENLGLSLEDYDRIIKEQNNKCTICKNQFTTEFQRRPNIDHCHKSGKFRSILCHKCNTALGLFDDNIQSLKQAIEYLNYHASK